MSPVLRRHPLELRIFQNRKVLVGKKGSKREIEWEDSSRKGARDLLAVDDRACSARISSRRFEEGNNIVISHYKLNRRRF